VFRASLRLCAALAALLLGVFPGCLNPRPEEDPQDLALPPESTGSGGSGTGGVLDPGTNIDEPAPDAEGPAFPPASELDAGVPDGGLPDGGACEPRSDVEQLPDAGPVGDAAP
jgi:hypothetical protein